MRAVEITLLSLLIFLMIRASMTDCKESIIKNRMLFCVGAAAFCLDIVYYAIFMKMFFRPFILNYLVLCFIAVIMYLFHIWAAGDTKMIIVAGLCIPGRMYLIAGQGEITSFLIFVFTFSTAFIYVLGDTVCKACREKLSMITAIKGVQWKHVIISYIATIAIINLINTVISALFRSVLAVNPMLSMACCFLTVLLWQEIKIHLTRKISIIIGAACLVVSILMSIFADFYFVFDFGQIAVVIAFMLIGTIVARYNYSIVPTSTVRKGQILSSATIMMFTRSTIKGLPSSMTEDLRSRITQEEAESIHRWETSKYGRPTVVIVNKIPFAVFISFGIVLFFIVGEVLS